MIREQDQAQKVEVERHVKERMKRHRKRTIRDILFPGMRSA